MSLDSWCLPRWAYHLDGTANGGFRRWVRDLADPATERELW